MLIDLIDRTTSYIRNSLGIKCNTLKSSEMDVAGEKDELIFNLCKAVGANKYISGPFGRDYLNHKVFEDAGIELVFHDYKHPEYKQAFSGFEPYMSAIDLLFNYGTESLKILTSKKIEG